MGLNGAIILHEETIVLLLSRGSCSCLVQCISILHSADSYCTEVRLYNYRYSLGCDADEGKFADHMIFSFRTETRVTLKRVQILRGVQIC